MRILCDNVMEGGRGYLPQDVGNMTLDQIIMLLVDRKNLINRSGTVQPAEAMNMASDTGQLRGRAFDGSVITGRVVGKSKARQLMEAAAKKTAPPRGRREKRRGN